MSKDNLRIEQSSSGEQYNAVQPHSCIRRNFKFKALGLIPLFIIAMTAFGGVKAHEKGDFIIRLGGAVTHINKDMFSDVALGFDAVSGSYVIDFSGHATSTGNQLENISFKTGNDTRPVLDLTYMLTDNVGLEAMFSATSRHDVRARHVGEEAEGSSDFEDFSDAGHNPGGSSLFEYRQQSFAAGLVIYPRGQQVSRFHPYFGAGINYTRSRVKLHDDYANYIDYLREEELKELAASGWTEDEIAEERKELEAEDVEHLDELRQAVHTRYNKWGANIKIGADFSLTDRFLLNAQARYNRTASNLGYWNYMVGMGVKF